MCIRKPKRDPFRGIKVLIQKGSERYVEGRYKIEPLLTFWNRKRLVAWAVYTFLRILRILKDKA